MGIWEASRALRTRASIASPKREVGQARAGRDSPSLRNVDTHLPFPACWLRSYRDASQSARPTRHLSRDRHASLHFRPYLHGVLSEITINPKILALCKIISKSMTVPLQDLAFGRFTAYLWQ